MSMADMTDGFVKSTESTFGKPKPSRETVRNAHRVVVKVRSHACLKGLCGHGRIMFDDQHAQLTACVWLSAASSGRVHALRVAPPSADASCMP